MKEEPLDTAQIQPRATSRPVYVPMVTALLKLLAQPTLKPLPIPGKHIRAGITKNKMQARDKNRTRTAKESRRRNRVR